MSAPCRPSLLAMEQSGLNCLTLHGLTGIDWAGLGLVEVVGPSWGLELAALFCITCWWPVPKPTASCPVSSSDSSSESQQVHSPSLGWGTWSEVGEGDLSWPPAEAMFCFRACGPVVLKQRTVRFFLFFFFSGGPM